MNEEGGRWPLQYKYLQNPLTHSWWQLAFGRREGGGYPAIRYISLILSTTEWKICTMAYLQPPAHSLQGDTG